VVVVMDHCDKNGGAKFRKECSLPLTGKGVVDLLITDLAVFEIDRHGGSGATLVELADGVSLDDIQSRTEAEFRLGPGIG
jgi:3-oxoacid CoA-transferase subunit B